MALTSVPLLREDSKLCWDIKGARGTTRGAAGVSATADWQSFGRVMEWTDMGPRQAVYRDVIAGAGREAATIGVAGTAYPAYSLGPYQIHDPRVMGFAWGREAANPAALGGGYFRHTVSPSTNGALPYMDVQMMDYKAGVATDGVTYLDAVMPRLSVRGEEPSEDGNEGSGRIMMLPTLLPHDDSTAITAKGQTLPTSEPYYKQHATIKFYNDDVDWRIHSWEFSIDSFARHNYYHRSGGDKPYEAPPEGAAYELRLDIVADGHQNSVTGSILRDLLRNKTKGNGQIKYARTANQDEWAINLTDIQIEEAPKRRTRGKIHYDVRAYVRASTFEYVDQNSGKYFPD